jgi:hypothetical protein
LKFQGGILFKGVHVGDDSIATNTCKCSDTKQTACKCAITKPAGEVVKQCFFAAHCEAYLFLTLFFTFNIGNDKL